MPVPTISPTTAGFMAQSKYSKLYNNPNFDYLSEMLPNNMGEMFKWCELVYNNAPVVADAAKKLINYAITTITYISESESAREETRKLFEDELGMKSILLNIGSDFFCYGNVFRSIYFPFDRFLKCKACGNQVNVRSAKYKMLRGKLSLLCSCGAKDQAEIIDYQSDDISKIRIVCWDPKQIELSYNPINGVTDYFYTLPSEVKRGLAAAAPVFIETLPIVFIEAFQKNKRVKLKGNFRHIKEPGLSGYGVGWGIPRTFAALKPYLYISILRKASEAIGLEHITPQKIVFPQGTSSDPSVMSSMGRWKEEITDSLTRWRYDPNHVMTAPYPTGVVNIGSQGRGLMPTEEIKDARMEMALAMGVPPELVLGGTNLTTSAVALRILENQLESYVDQVVEFMNWVSSSIGDYYDKEYSAVGLTPFTMADDLVKKQMLMQLTGQMTSKRTLLEALGIDPDEESERLKDEQIAAHRDSKDVERRIVEEEENIASQAQSQEVANATGRLPQYDQQKLYAAAQGLAQQLIVIPYEQRRSELSDLQNQDYVMWAMVSKILEKMHNEADSNV